MWATLSAVLFISPVGVSFAEEAVSQDQSICDDTTINNIASSVRTQIERCWVYPEGLPDGISLEVAVEISLAPDGSLVVEPRLVEPRLDDPNYKAFADAAVNAVNRCQPYDLPAEHYEVWKEIRLNFDPRRMIGL